MANLVLDNRVLTTIASLAMRLKMTQEEIVAQAIDNYEKKINRKNRLMSFAGILEEDEADELLNSIHENRRNKEMELQV